jgi:hypothetical protein
MPNFRTNSLEGAAVLCMRTSFASWVISSAHKMHTVYALEKALLQAGRMPSLGGL